MLGPELTAAGVAAIATAGYQSMAPTGQWFGRTFAGVDRGSKLLALTFDDGPNDPHTLHLLDILAKHEVRATFFLIGRYVQQRPDMVRELVKAGHVVGNHTFSHPLLIFKSTLEVKNELETCRRALSDAVGEHSNLFRPPFGGRRPAVLRIARLECTVRRVYRRKSSHSSSRRRRGFAARWRTSANGCRPLAYFNGHGSADWPL